MYFVVVQILNQEFQHPSSFTLPSPLGDNLPIEFFPIEVV